MAFSEPAKVETRFSNCVVKINHSADAIPSRVRIGKDLSGQAPIVKVPVFSLVCSKLRKQQQSQSLEDEEEVQMKALNSGRVSDEHAEEILDLSRELLKDQNALEPTRIPGQRLGK